MLRQKDLDHGPQFAGEDGRRTTGRDGDHDRTPIDNRRRDEAAVGLVVDAVAKNAGSLGRFEHSPLDLRFSGRADHEPVALDVGCPKFTRVKTKPMLADELGECPAGFGRNNRNFGTRREQQARFSMRDVAAADDKAAPSLQIQERRKIVHKVVLA